MVSAMAGKNGGKMVTLTLDNVTDTLWNVTVTLSYRESPQMARKGQNSSFHDIPVGGNLDRTIM